jgi:sigma-B regulation protein RsbU (phosphoserine phosphatase)
VEQGLSDEKEMAKLREQFIAVLGHDLRNPLGSMVNGLRLLEHELDSARKERVVGLMRNSARRMLELIDDVLDLARGRLGHGIIVNRQLCELDPLLRQVVSELQIAHAERAFESAFSITEPVYCDRGRLGQLASNLLGNALTHGSSSAPVRIGAATVSGNFEFWVANAGTPIPEATMLRLFQPFFRGEVRESKQGLGLGLYISSEIAKAHRGELTVTSSAAETRFTFRMPLTLGQDET